MDGPARKRNPSKVDRFWLATRGSSLGSMAIIKLVFRRTCMTRLVAVATSRGGRYLPRRISRDSQELIWHCERRNDVQLVCAGHFTSKSWKEYQIGRASCRE